MRYLIPLIAVGLAWPATAAAAPVADVLAFHMNEGSGTTVSDATGNYNGTYSGTPTWTTDARFGYALDLTGKSDYVNTALTQAQPLPLSVEAWVKTNQMNTGGIVNKYISGSYNGFQVFMNSGHLSAWYAAPPNRITRTDGSSDPDLVISDGAWHHTVTVFDTTGTTHYVDGVYADDVGWTGASGNSAETTPLHIGNYGSNYFDGLIDEVAIYNRALTAEEAAQRFADGPPQPPALPPAKTLVLNLNENAGTVTDDEAGYGYNGELKAGAQWTADGKFDSAVDFRGNNGYVETTLTDAIAPPLTVEGWVKTTDTRSYDIGMINKYASGSAQGFQTFIRDGNLRAWYYDGSTRARIDSSTFIADDQWHHHAAVWDASGLNLYLDGRRIARTGWTSGVGSSSETTPLRLGTYPNGVGVPYVFFDGVLDGVGIYDKALSADEVAGRWADGPPQAPPLPMASLLCLNLDENQGTTTRDSYSGLDATIYSEGSPSDTLWTSAGKFGSALQFDNTKEQYVETQLTAAQPVPLTVEAWVKVATDVPASHVALVNKYYASSLEGFQLFLNSGDVSAWYYTHATHTAAYSGIDIADDTWHHVAAIFDDGGTRVFLDGDPVGSAGWTAGVGTSNETTPLRLGRYPGGSNYYKGFIDEVALYNRVLTDYEIRARFNDGPPFVPEPASFLLLAAGAGLLIVSRWRRKLVGS